MFYAYGDHMSADVAIQYQNRVGVWIEVSRVPNQSQMVIMGMHQVESLYPGRRVRAVDMDGRVVDILT
jgi:hypothetical protein